MSCLFVEQLTVIDAAYLDVRRGLVGESWIVDLALEGELDALSMVLDFSEVKRRLKRVIDDSADHTLIVPRHAPELSLTQIRGRCELLFRSDLGVFEHVSPRCAVTLLDAAAVDESALVAHLLPRIREAVPPSVQGIGLTLRHERCDGAHYHYVHGLKKHAGHCQRIAHGHRSRIEVRVDGERDPAAERDIAARWLDIYLGSEEDLVARGNGRLRYAYEATEGRFELALPESRNDLFAVDTTVERVAQVLATRVAGMRRGATVEVRAYEGVMKGALARATTQDSGAVLPPPGIVRT